MPHEFRFSIVSECEGDFARYGDTYRGVGWTKSQDHANRRYQVMLEAIRRPTNGEVEVLDLGCGASHLYEYMRANGVRDVRYSGLDLSPRFIAVSQRKFPDVTYYRADILDERTVLPSFDYVLMNGLFNYKGRASQQEMWAYVQAMLRRAGAIARVGFAFNVMSKYVDWERDDLFHLPLDTAAAFVATHVSREFVIRHDYGLFEYTVYVYGTATAA
jgi:SAM-dependent methyltransferase